MPHEPRRLAILAARTILEASDTIILDTETSGLTIESEVIEVAAVRAKTGRIAINTFIRPVRPFKNVPELGHNITWESLDSSPRVNETPLAELLRTSRVVCYNAQFDYRLLSQNYEAVGEKMPSAGFACAMLMYAAYRSKPKVHSSWFKLQVAAEHEGIPVTQEHRALSDVHLTRELLMVMAEADENE